MPVLALNGIFKRFGRHTALDDVSLTVEAGEVVAIIGRSGSGKTTLLRCVDGLEVPDRGEVFFDDRRIDYSSAGLRALRRHIGIVFQNFNLFPHLSVERNITLGLTEAKGLPLADAKEQARIALRQVDLEDKIAAIGIRIRRWVTLHGIALNIEPDLSHFAGIVPCGVSELRRASYWRVALPLLPRAPRRCHRPVSGRQHRVHGLNRRARISGSRLAHRWWANHRGAIDADAVRLGVRPRRRRARSSCRAQ